MGGESHNSPPVIYVRIHTSRRLMLSLAIWWAGLFLDAAILFRSYRGRSFAKYPYFYTYFTCIVIVDLTRYFVYTHDPPAFRNWYWSTQFLSVAIGYGVILEIVRHALARYPGVARFGSRILWTSFFAVLTYIASKSLTVTNWSAAATGAELERDLRTVQAFALAGILILISHYRIEIGRNLKGIIAGYGLFIALSVMNLAVQAHAGASIQGVLRSFQSYSFFISQFVWITALWSYQPSPKAAAAGMLESDYKTLSHWTKEMLRALRKRIPGKLKE
jgi:hypothetical protein